MVYNGKPSTVLKQLFEEIIRELQTKQPIYEMVCVSKLFNVLALLSRSRRLKEVQPLTQYGDKISFVIQKMNMEYDKNYSLEDYAAICYMSKFHFIRVFKTVTGKTPLEYRTDIRFEHAKELLLDTELSINEIAKSTGFESGIYFCNAFKKRMGVSPSQYRYKKIH